MVRRARPAVVRITSGTGTGTGVIFDTQGRTGYVVTNEHVVEGQSRVSVTVNDSTTYSGTVLGVDAVRDLAVVSICCGDFTALEFGDAAGLEAGDEIVAIGYALGLSGEATVTRGIVSAVRYDSRFLSDVIQTDAAINPGNSGGPMLSMSGQILGINTFGYDETQSGRPVEGLSFAISAVTVQQQIPRLRAGTAVPTATPVSPTPVPSTSEGYDFGPMNGELRHDPSDNFIETEYAGVSFSDMVVEATFVNPYAGSSNSWDFGFFLRNNRGYDRNSSFLQIVVSSNKRWAVRERSNDSSKQISGGTINDLTIASGGRNHLMMVTIESRGWVFVNGDFVVTVDLSNVARSGDVAVVTGAFEGDEVAGAVTRYEGFKGYELKKKYGPAAGVLEKEAGFIGTHHSGVRARNFVAESEFINPRGSNWDYGFIVRDSDFRWEVIVVTDDERWFHKTRNLDDEAYTDVTSGYLRNSIIDWSSSRNSLLFIATETSGWFFINNLLLTKLDLGHNQDIGYISAAGDFFLAHNGKPEFEEFNVWAP